MNDTRIHLTEIRASEIAKWLDCPQKALYNHMKAKPAIDDVAHVGSVLGDHVHKQLTGHVPSPQRQVIYDEVTLNEYVMGKQVKAYVRAIKNFVDQRGWSIVETEIPMRVKLTVAQALIITVTGTIDAIAVDEQGNYYILDYKTGKALPFKGMSQLAVYAWLYKMKQLKFHDKIKAVGVVYMQRRKFGVQTASQAPLTWGTPYADAVTYGKEIVFHTAKMATGVATPYYNPSGFHCFDCERPCDFRISAEVLTL